MRFVRCYSLAEDPRAAEPLVDLPDEIGILLLVLDADRTASLACDADRLPAPEPIRPRPLEDPCGRPPVCGSLPLDRTEEPRRRLLSRAIDGLSKLPVDP